MGGKFLLRSHSRYVLAAAFCVQLAFMVTSNAWAATQSISGDPLDIYVLDTGKMALWYQNVYQYYGQDNWGSVLIFDNGMTTEKYSSPYQAGYGPTTFTAVTNSKPDAWRVDTVMDAGGSGMRVTQRVDYTDGQSYYKMTWTITNSSGTTYTNCKFFHGGDAYFGGNDAAQSYWNDSLGMVYLRNPGLSGLMGFYGGIGSRADRYFGGQYNLGNSFAVGGELPNTVNPAFIDAGYYLQWNRASLAPGQSWVITAYEKWTESGDVQVLAPADQECSEGETVDLTFYVQNFQGVADVYNLVASSDLGWAVSLPGGGSVPLASGETATITVSVDVPGNADGLTDTITLRATSQSNGTITTADSTQLICPAYVADEDDEEDEEEITTSPSNDKDHDRLLGIKCFIETASAQGGALMPLLAAFLFAGLARVGIRRSGR